MALTSQITTSLLQVDGRMTEGGVIEIVPGARLLLDVGVEDIEPGALLDDIAAAVAEAKAARDEAAEIRNDIIDGFGLAYDTDGIPYLT